MTSSTLLTDLKHLFFDTIDVRRYPTVVDADGYPDFSTSPVETIQSRVAGKIQNVLGTDGQEHVTNIVVTTLGDFGLTTKDQITVPVRFSRNPRDPNDLAARQFEPKAVETLSGRHASSHQKLYL